MPFSCSNGSNDVIINHLLLILVIISFFLIKILTIYFLLFMKTESLIFDLKNTPDPWKSAFMVLNEFSIY
jgi:hypothetical protein